MEATLLTELGAEAEAGVVAELQAELNAQLETYLEAQIQSGAAAEWGFFRQAFDWAGYHARIAAEAAQRAAQEAARRAAEEAERIRLAAEAAAREAARIAEAARIEAERVAAEAARQARLAAEAAAREAERIAQAAAAAALQLQQKKDSAKREVSLMIDQQIADYVKKFNDAKKTFDDSIAKKRSDLQIKKEE